MDVNVVIGVYHGVIDSCHVLTDPVAARQKLADVKRDLEIEEGDEGESPNSAELLCVGVDM